MLHLSLKVLILKLHLILLDQKQLESTIHTQAKILSNLVFLNVHIFQYYKTVLKYQLYLVHLFHLYTLFGRSGALARALRRAGAVRRGRQQPAAGWRRAAAPAAHRQPGAGAAER